MTAAIEFQPWPKTPRLFRDAVVTEKIDGTNAAVQIIKVPLVGGSPPELPEGATVVHWDADADHGYAVAAQSRKRLITPLDDNFTFAAWVLDNALGLIRLLGEGTHYGEWWGSGIQRGYGLTGGDKRFSLFNVHRYSKVLQAAAEGHLPDVPGLGVVPVLAQRTFSTDLVHDALVQLQTEGSQAAPGFDRPEGVVVYHSASRSVFKVLIENDDTPKGVAS